MVTLTSAVLFPSCSALCHVYLHLVAARERIVGWYHTGPKLHQNDVRINELIRRYCAGSVSMIIKSDISHWFPLLASKKGRRLKIQISKDSSYTQIPLSSCPLGRLLYQRPHMINAPLHPHPPGNSDQNNQKWLKRSSLTSINHGIHYLSTLSPSDPVCFSLFLMTK